MLISGWGGWKKELGRRRVVWGRVRQKEGRVCREVSLFKSIMIF